MHVRSPKEIGLLVREERRRLHLTQQALAERAGVTRQWIRMLEHGKPRLELGLTLRALTALGLTVDVQNRPSLETTTISSKPQIPSRTASTPKSGNAVDIDAIVRAATGSRK